MPDKNVKACAIEAANEIKDLKDTLAQNGSYIRGPLEEGAYEVLLGNIAADRYRECMDRARKGTPKH